MPKVSAITAIERPASRTKGATLHGYRRSKCMGRGYGGVEEDGLGAGTYSFQRDIRDVLWGHVPQVECIGLEALYTRGPGRMYRMGHEGRATMYKEFMTKS